MKKATVFFSIVLVVFLLDQWTKDYMWNAVFARRGQLVEVTSWLNWRYAQNTGMAWSLLSDYPQYLLILTSAISLVVIFIALKTSCGLKVLSSWALVVGGALGNIWDRLISLSGNQLMAVRDFIDIHWQQYHWPTFNLADTFICLGAGYLFLHSFTQEPYGKN